MNAFSQEAESQEYWKHKLALHLNENGFGYRAFITLDYADTASVTTIEKDVTRFLLRAARYSGSHLDNLISCETSSTGHSHAHILMLSEKPINRKLISKRWKKGHIDWSDKGNLLELEHFMRASDYIMMKHEYSAVKYRFCPNSAKCNKCT